MQTMSITPIEPARKPRASGREAHAPAAAIADQPKLPPRRRPNPWVRRGLVFATCVLMLDALFGERGLAETIRARETYEIARQDLERIRQANSALREQARRLREDPAAVESVARGELGLARPGEILVVVRDVKPPRDPAGK
jgi:cell division protein FtsB